MGRALEASPVVRIHGSLARNRTHALSQRYCLRDCVIPFVFDERKFACWRGRLFGYDRFMMGKHWLTPNATICGIIIFAFERTSDRPAHPIPLE
jgi:hypothetical protein